MRLTEFGKNALSLAYALGKGSGYSASDIAILQAVKRRESLEGIVSACRPYRTFSGFRSYASLAKVLDRLGYLKQVGMIE